MKFECTADQLLSLATIAVRFVEKRPNLPVLASILITAEGSRVLFRATNLECGVEVTGAAKVSSAGVAAVSGSVLMSFLSNVRGKSVSVELAGGVLKFQTEFVSASLKTVSPEDFPTLPRVSASTSFTVRAPDLVKAIRSVVYCASTSTIKPELQSILLHGEGGKLTAVATDSFRLAEKTISLRGGGSLPQLLLPAHNAAELMRILEGTTGDVELYYNENQLSTHVDAVYYTSRLVDGAFPNYRQIIPKSFTTEGVVLKEDMSAALKSLAVFGDKFAQVSVAITPGKKSIIFSSRNPDIGEQTYIVHATLQGEAVAVNFNGRYLSDGLQPIAGESVRVHSNGAGKPLLLKDAADDSFMYLAMPMNR